MTVKYLFCAAILVTLIPAFQLITAAKVHGAASECPALAQSTGPTVTADSVAGGDFTDMVPEAVIEPLRARIRELGGDGTGKVKIVSLRD